MSEPHSQSGHFGGKKLSPQPEVSAPACPITLVQADWGIPHHCWCIHYGFTKE